MVSATSGHGWVTSAILAFMSSSRSPASATGHWSSGCGPSDRSAVESARPAAADVIAALNARRASEYWTLARIAWPQPIADEAKMSAGALVGATRATRKAGAQREPRPANASTASGRGCAGPLAGWMACTATQSQVGVSEESTAGLPNR